MKVLVLSNLYPPDMIGGYELGCRQVVDGLRGQGHDVRVLTSAHRKLSPGEPHVRRVLRLTDIWSDYLFQRSTPVVAHLNQARSLRVDASNVHALLAELDEFRPDVVYPWMLAGLGGLGLMGTLHHLRVPWVWHLMDDVPLLLCKAAGQLVPAFAEEFAHQFRGTFLACSQQLVDEIEAGGISLGKDVEVLPNWVVGGSRDPVGRPMPDGDLRIVSAAGQIDRRGDKGLDLLVESARTLRDRGRESFRIDLYGHVADGSIPELIHRYDLADRVVLRGTRTQSQLADLYPEYDVFAFPTRPREPFGFAPLEAAARGCVPVISQVCGLAEWLVDGVHCLKAPRRASAFASVFESILDQKHDLAALGRRAAHAVQRDFHLDALLPRIESALTRASRRSRAGAGRPEEAYRLAVLAERLTQVLLQESLVA